MASRAPVFPIPDEQHHYSDYGFDPEMDYFQVLEEAMRQHGKRSAADKRSPIRSTLRKPISKDDRCGAAKRRKWWKSALLFWKRDDGRAGGKGGKASLAARRTVSRPVYMVEGGRSGSSTPCRSSRPPGSGPLREGVGHYLSLRDFNGMEDDDGPIAAGGAVPAHMPVYLVT